MRASFKKIFKKRTKDGKELGIVSDFKDPVVVDEKESAVTAGCTDSVQSSAASNKSMTCESHQETGPNMSDPKGSLVASQQLDSAQSRPRSASKEVAHTYYDDAPHVIKSYDQIPVLEQTKLPRGGISMETKAVGRVQVSPDVN